jgi:hypothetical protein
VTTFSAVAPKGDRRLARVIVAASVALAILLRGMAAITCAICVVASFAIGFAAFPAGAVVFALRRYSSWPAGVAARADAVANTIRRTYPDVPENILPEIHFDQPDVARERLERLHAWKFAPFDREPHQFESRKPLP